MSTALVKPEAEATIGPFSPPVVLEPGYEVQHPAQLVYSYGFEDYSVHVWTPADLGTALVGWFEASQGVQTSAGVVTGWADQSGRGATLVPPNTTTGAPTPATSSALGGLPVVRFTPWTILSGTDPDWGLSGGSHSIFVLGARSGPSTGDMVGTGAVGDGHSLLMQFSGIGNRVRGHVWGQGSAAVADGTTIPAPGESDPFIVGQMLDATTFAAYANGRREGVVARPTTLATPSTQIVLNSRGGLIGAGGNFDVQTVVLTKAISQADTDRLNGYLAWKAGQASLLPSTHPYRYGPPSTVINDGLDGWTGGTNVASPRRTGARAFQGATLTRTFTGLQVGRSYTLQGWRYNGTSWALSGQLFTASAASMSRTLSGLGATHWDDITLTRNAWVEQIPPVTSPFAPLPISGGQVTLDESWSPFAQATVEVPLTDVSFLERIDPRDDRRVILTASEGVGGSSRVFDLGLRGRTVDHKTGKVSLELASDEALLFDKRRLAATADKTPRTHEASLRAVCSWALGKVGAALEAGTTDAVMTAAWRVSNLIANPSMETGLTGWTLGANASTLTQTAVGSPPPDFGTMCARWVSVAAGATYLDYLNVSVAPGRRYTLSAQMFANPGATGRVMIRFKNSAGQVLREVFSSATTLPGAIWTRVSAVSVGSPPGAVTADLHFEAQVNAAARPIRLDCVMFYEGDELVPYFDGARADDALYIYDWSGTANASTSTREPIINRPPELFDWKPGQSLNDFLRPLVEASGLRLFCDEKRVWRLVDPSTYEVPGYVVAQSGHNATEGTDTISRNTDEWATGVLVVYRWTDADGTRQEAYDFAGTDAKVVTIERESEFPGPGAAVYFLNSRQGRGRAQEVTALVNFAASPTQGVTINLPGTLTQTGKVRRVSFGLSDGLMDLGTRGLTDTLPGSWATRGPDETWSDVDPTLKWKDA